MSAAQREAQAALRATSTDALLDSIIQLTHQISHAHRDREQQTKADLRAQRLLVRAEILRRTGDA